MAQTNAPTETILVGTNGIRAWNPFSLGLGSYQNSENNIDYFLGDIKLESNIEYRFPLFNVDHTR